MVLFEKDTECKIKCILMEKIDGDSTKAKIKAHQNVLSEFLLLHLGIGWKYRYSMK